MQLAGEGTRVIGPATVTEQLKGSTVVDRAGRDASSSPGIEVTAVAAYNTNKLDSEGKPFHPREAGWVGYVISDGGRRIYHSGDTDVIPEMDQAPASTSPCCRSAGPT